ncbi:MAG TPA: hypothetical protein EYN93_08990 [Planctomycetaceae bacterium]|nr:hypothetical protein [Planctomycetaceae bacterium]
MDDIFKTGSNYRDMTHLLTTQLELATCGARQYGMYDWLISSARSVGNLVNTKKIQGSGFEVDPFILASQKDVIKDNYWVVHRVYSFEYKSMAATSGTVLAAAHADEKLLVSATGSSVPAATGKDYNIIKVSVPSNGNQPVAASYFAPGMHFHMFVKTSTGDAYRLEWKVIQAVGGTHGASAPLGAGSDFIDIEADFIGGYGGGAGIKKGDSANTATQKYWNADFKQSGSLSESALSLLVSRATGGIIVNSANNVNDFEKWCENRPALSTLKHVPFWFQTSRYTLCVDQFYKEWLERMMRNNVYFQKFGDVPLAERNKQLGLQFQKEWVNSFFWGQPLNGQTLSGYQSTLEQVNSYPNSVTTGTPVPSELTSGMEDSFISYRANATGIYRQLQDAGRVTDKQGGPLTLETDLFDKLFEVVRSRKDQGKPADSIDVFTDTRTARQIWRAMIKYYTEDGKLGDTSFATRWDMGNKSLFGGFHSQSFELHHPVGVTLNVITNEFFDDMLTTAKIGDVRTYGTAGKADGSAGRFLMVLDLGGGIYPGIIDSNRVVHSTGNLDDLAKVNSDYACVMKNPTKEVTLNSQTWTAIVECPLDNLIIENFDNTIPVHGVS